MLRKSFLGDKTEENVLPSGGSASELLSGTQFFITRKNLAKYFSCFTTEML